MRGADGHLDDGRRGRRRGRRRPRGRPDDDDRSPRSGPVVAGLLARRAAGAGAITVLPCDNLPDNGPAFRTVVARPRRPRSTRRCTAWIDDNVDFATSMVDRITPATTDDDRQAVAGGRGLRRRRRPCRPSRSASGSCPGTFPAGRPAWDAAGVTARRRRPPVRAAQALAAQRLALAPGLRRQHPRARDRSTRPSPTRPCRGWVEEWWDEAGPHLPLSPADVAATTARRCSTGSPTRACGTCSPRSPPTARTSSPSGSCPCCARSGRRPRPDGCATALAAWVLHLRGPGAPVNDPERDRPGRPRRPRTCGPRSSASSTSSRPDSGTTTAGRRRPDAGEGARPTWTPDGPDDPAPTSRLDPGRPSRRPGSGRANWWRP